MTSLAHSPSAHSQPGSVKTVADILTAAADLIEPEGAWIQGAHARVRNYMGGFGHWSHPRACGWCAAGAINKAASEIVGYDDVRTTYGPTWQATLLFNESVGVRMTADFNDAPKRTQAEVVAALRAAAEKARTAAEPDSVGTTEGREP